MFKHNPSGEMAGDDFLRWCDRTGHDVVQKILGSAYVFTRNGDFQFLRQLCGEPIIDVKCKKAGANQVKFSVFAYDNHKKLCAVFTAVYVGKEKAYCEVQ